MSVLDVFCDEVFGPDKLLLLGHFGESQRYPYRFQLQLFLYGHQMYPRIESFYSVANGTTSLTLDVIDTVQVLQYLHQGVQGDAQPLYSESRV